MSSDDKRSFPRRQEPCSGRIIDYDFSVREPVRDHAKCGQNLQHSAKESQREHTKNHWEDHVSRPPIPLMTPRACATSPENAPEFSGVRLPTPAVLLVDPTYDFEIIPEVILVSVGSRNGIVGLVACYRTPATSGFVFDVKHGRIENGLAVVVVVVGARMEYPLVSIDDAADMRRKMLSTGWKGRVQNEATIIGVFETHREAGKTPHPGRVMHNLWLL
ncbi:hypothetical protein BU15DRAFT_67831 [Melanogaster broomeanus]|nr:hypothetical protein BU15DRAFT_67831 [Melanogaster broomeanus]